MHCSFLPGILGFYHDCDWIWSLPTSAELPSLGRYLLLFAATNILEAPLYFLFFRKWTPTLVLNLASHPFLIFLLQPLLARAKISTGTGLLFMESMAIMIEVLVLIYFYKKGRLQAWSASILANLWSWNVGIYLMVLYYGI